MAHANIEDPCGEIGPDQRWAMVWFVVVVIIGACATYTLTRIDRKNYDTKGQFFDYEAYRQNRLATTTIGSDTKDPRASSMLSGKFDQ